MCAHLISFRYQQPAAWAAQAALLGTATLKPPPLGPCREAAAGSTAIPPIAVRYDAAVALTTAARRPGRFLSFLAARLPSLAANTSFGALVDGVVSNPGLRAFVDVLCVGTSGAPAADISAEYMVRAVAEMYAPGGPRAASACIPCNRTPLCQLRLA